MNNYEIRLFKDKSDYINRITCYCEFMCGNEEIVSKRVKELLKKFDVTYWETEKLQ